MKNTYLVFIDPQNERSGLRVATAAEWDQILSSNRGAAQEERRYFICDCFEDCGELDRMYIETTKSEFDKWHSQNVEAERKRKIGRKYGKVSLQQLLQAEDELSFCDTVEGDSRLEELICDEASIQQLREKLAAWKPWAVEMLELYLNGQKKKASMVISEKYETSVRTAQRWKEKFEAYVISFFAKQ